MEASVPPRMLVTCCSLALDWHGLSIRSRCVGRALAGCMRLRFFALTTGTTFAKAPWSDIVLQGFVQGVLTAIISLLLYGRAVGILGASSGAAFAALSPAMTALLGIP